VSVKEVVTELYRSQLRSFLDTGARLRWPACETPAVSVILVLYNRAELTLRCLRSLHEHAPEPLEILVVDNASADDTSELLDRLDGVRIIRNYENRGFLLAVNQAARRARGAYLLFLNNDAEVLPGTLEAALAAARSAPDVGAVGGRILLLDGRLQEAGSVVWQDGSCLGYGRGDAPDAGPYMYTRDVDYCSGAFLLTPRALFLEDGGFDERFKPAYYEEVDYCFRLWGQGKRVVYEPRAVVVHYEFASSRSMDEAVQMQLTRRAAFARKHEAALAAQPAPQVERVLFARQRPARGRRLLLLDDRVPHEHLGSGFPRARRLLETLVEQGHFVTFYPLSHPSEPWDEVYADIPRTVEVMNGLGPHALPQFLRERRGYYDALIVSRPHNMSLLRRLAGRELEGCPLVYDAEAVFVLRDIARQRVLGQPLSDGEVAALVREEAALAAGADAVLAVSESEREIFAGAGASAVFVLGHTVRVQPTPRTFAEREGLLLVGPVHRDVDPNADGLRWFAAEVLPRVRAALGEGLIVRWAGPNASEKLARLAADAGIEALGRVDDLSALYGAARVFVAPTRYCAGVPLKIYHAAAHGLPCAGTSLVREQIGWQGGVEMLAADTAEDLARACVQLHTDASAWQGVREAALLRVAEDGSARRFSNALAAALAAAFPGAAVRARHRA
jgi:O-antigen biosynthesis protein